MFKYTTHTLKKLETLCQEAEYIIRYEKGNFNSGYCILENRRVIVINKFFTTESRINSLLDILPQITIDLELLSEKSREFYQSLPKEGDPSKSKKEQS